MSMNKIFLLSLVSVILVSCSSFYHEKEIPKIKHTLEKDSEEELFWSKSGIYLYNDEHSSMLTGAPDKVVFIGEEYNNHGKGLYIYNSVTGNLVWDKGINLPSQSIVNDSNLYLGGYNIVQAYDIQKGDLLWETDLQRAGNVIYLYYLLNKIYIYTNSGKSFTLDINGDIQNSSDRNLTEIPFISNDITYINRINSIEAIDTVTGKSNWNTTLDGFISLGPIFLEDMIYIRTGRLTVPGYIYALDKISGRIVWKTGKNVISNICTLDSNLLFLKQDGSLVVLDRIDGHEKTSINFSPGTFLLNEPGKNIGGYYIASDPKNRIVFISFGDSHQIIAIKLTGIH